MKERMTIEEGVPYYRYLLMSNSTTKNIPAKMNISVLVNLNGPGGGASVGTELGMDEGQVGKAEGILVGAGTGICEGRILGLYVGCRVLGREVGGFVSPSNVGRGVTGACVGTEEGGLAKAVPPTRTVADTILDSSATFFNRPTTEANCGSLVILSSS